MGRMPKPNEALKDFFKDNNTYADAFNAAYFGGAEYFNGDDLSEGDTVYENSIEINGQVIRFKRYRDIVRISVSGVYFVILCIEDQDMVNYAQPLREMIYDSLGYLEQVKAKTVFTEKTRWTSEEYLSGFSKESRIRPIMNLVIYTGERPWDGPMTLHDMLEMDESLKRFVPDYPLYLIDLGHNKGYNFRDRKLRELSEILNMIYSGEETDKEVGRDMLSLAGILANDRKLYIAANKGAKEGGSVNMCNILAERDRRSEARGISIGEARGEINGQNKLVDAVKRLRLGESIDELLASGIDKRTLEQAMIIR